MPYRYIIKLLPRLLLLTTLMIVASGCKKDGECYGSSNTLIYISVGEGPDSSSGAKENSHVDNVFVFIYDKDAQLQRIAKLSREEIANRTPVEVPVYEDNHPQVVVWGNLNGAEDISDVTSVFLLSSARINMQQKDGYTASTDNLYYGFKKLTEENEQEIVITSWVSHVYITVRGIEKIPNDTAGYYFTIENNCSSYDFYGQPQQGKVLIKVEAEAKVYHQEVVLVHQPINLVACPKIAGEKQSMSVKLYRRTPEGDVLMASTNRDTEGEQIITRSGENTNVLLDLTDKAHLSVYCILTPWDYIYQWSWW